MHAPEARAPVAPQSPQFRPENEDLNAGALQPAAKARCKIPRAEAIEKQMHPHAARRGPSKRFSQPLTNPVPGVDVGL
jgi:hypothetical protein